MAGGKQGRLSDEHIQRIVEMTLEIQKKKEAEERKARYDRRFMNTKLLLKNFRAFADMENSSIYEASQCSDDAYEILSTMFDQPSMDELRVESIKKSAGRTKIIMEHIRAALESYRKHCLRTGRTEDDRRYRTVCRLFIDEDAWTAQDIAAGEHVDIRTVYNDMNEAISALTPRIFGIDGLKPADISKSLH